MIRLISALVLFAAFTVAHAQGVPDTIKKITSAKTVTIAYRTDALPFSFEGDGKQPTGYTIDLCKKVVSSLESQLKVQPLQIKWVAATSQNRLELVRSGQVDMECGATTVTLARMSDVDFSSYIFLDTTGVIVRSSIGAKSFKDLAGKRIAVVSNTTNQAAVDAAIKRAAPGATMVPVKTRDDGAAQLQDGKVDAFASDKVLLLGLARKIKDPAQYTLLGDDLSFEPYAIALPRGDTNFRIAVNRALSEIYRSNDIVDIFRRTFGPDLDPTAALLVTFGLGAYPN